MPKTIEKLNVIFETNSKSIDLLISDVLVTQLMVTVSRIGLRMNRINNNDAIIEKEKEYDKK